MKKIIIMKKKKNLVLGLDGLLPNFIVREGIVS